MSQSKNDAVATLSQASIALCQTTLDRLNDSTSSKNDPIKVADVRQDLISLLTLLGKECTSLSLAFKPPATIPAIEGTLKKIHEIVTKMAFCLNLCPPEGALSKEIRWLGEEAVESMQRLLQGSLEAHQASTAIKRKELRERNLKLTGQVWEVVTRAETLSSSELEALRKNWQSTLGLLEDCLEEVKEMEQQGEDGDDSNDDSDDEEDVEDDFRASHPLTRVEKARVAAAHVLLRLGKLLLNRLVNSTAHPDVLRSFSDETVLHRVATLVGRMSETADDFALSLEPPQEDVVEVVGVFEQVCKELGAVLGDAVQGQEKDEKWVNTWKEQFDRASDKVKSLI